MFRTSLMVIVAATGLVGVAAAQPAAPAVPPAFSLDQALGDILGQPGGLTADQAAARAAQASPTAQRRAAEVAEAQAVIRQVDVAVMPRVSLGASYTRLSNVDNPELAPGFSFPVLLDSWHAGASVDVPLTDYLVRFPAAKKLVRENLAAAKLGERAAAAAAATDARVAYYEWVRAELQVVVAERRRLQVEGTRAQVAALVEVQRASRADLLRLDAQQAQADLAVAQLRDLTAIRAEQLRILTGLPADAPLTIGEDVRDAEPLPAIGSAAELTADALGRRLELHALDVGVAALGRQRELSSLGKLPRVDLFANVAYDNPNPRILPPEDKFSLTWAAGARVTWSLNDFLDVAPADAQVDAQVRALQADRRGLELAIRGEITAARSAVLLADKTQEATAQGLIAAEEGYRVRQELLAAERATAIELVDAETELTRARVAVIDALIDRRIAWARLRHAAGLDVQ